MVRAHLGLLPTIVNVPGKGREVHDEHHLCERDFDLCDGHTVDGIDDVTGV